MMNFSRRTISSIESVLERDSLSVEIDPAATETETDAIEFFPRPEEGVAVYLDVSLSEDFNVDVADFNPKIGER